VNKADWPIGFILSLGAGRSLGRLAPVRFE